MQHRHNGPLALLGAALAAASLAQSAGPAHALEPAAGEAEAIKACERQLCTMVLGRQSSGPDLTCDVAKTWDRDTLKKGDSSSVSWGFGDARCAVDLELSRADVIAALTKDKHTISVPEHKVNCVVEQGGKAKPLVAKVAPKLEFKKGKADKIWINLGEVEGPTAVKATVNLAATLEDTLGLFHSSMVKSVNKFLHKRCAKRYFADGRPRPDADEKKKKKEKLAEKAKGAPAVKAGAAPGPEPAKPAPIAAGEQ